MLLEALALQQGAAFERKAGRVFLQKSKASASKKTA